MNTQSHICGGTVLCGGCTGETAHVYCDRCGAFTHDIDAKELPSGADRDTNRAAWDAGDYQSPDAEDET